MGSVLIVEDDRSLGDTLRDRLTKEGYRVDLVGAVHAAEAALVRQSYDLVLVDIGLPDASGFRVGRRVKDSSHAALIFLTAMNSAESRLEGFEIGADDYIPKPFHLKELLLRIRRVLDAKKIEPRIETAALVINTVARSVTFPDGRTVNPQVRDFELLSLLVRASPRALTRRDILDAVWPSAKQLSSERTVDNAVVRLRQLLGSDYESFLQSVRGVGYRWAPREGDRSPAE